MSCYLLEEEPLDIILCYSIFCCGLKSFVRVIIGFLLQYPRGDVTFDLKAGNCQLLTNLSYTWLSLIPAEGNQAYWKLACPVLQGVIFNGFIYAKEADIVEIINEIAFSRLNSVTAHKVH